MSITLSRNRVVLRIVSSYLCQSNSYWPSAFLLTRFAKLIEPRLHDSYGYSDCSPHGFVALSGPPLAFANTLYLLILSKNISPGSALFHADNAIRSMSWCALISFTGALSRGLRSVYFPSAESTSADQKSSQTPTDTLKFSRIPASVLFVMNFSMSGCHASKMPIFAPRLLPPCLTTSVTVLMMFIKDTGPDATPDVEATISPSCLRSE